MVTTRAELFQEQSYLHVPGVINAPLLADLVADTEHRIGEGGGEAWAGKWRNQYPDGSAFTLKTIKNIHQQSELWARLANDLLLIEVIAELMGATPVVDQSMLIAKPPEHGQAFPLHQDSAYYAKELDRYLIAIVSLDATSDDNGGVRYVPGSHRLGRLEHTRDGKWHLPQYRMEDTVQIPTRPGDAVISDINTVHASLPNRSNKIRRTVRIGYRPR